MLTNSSTNYYPEALSCNLEGCLTADLSSAPTQPALHASNSFAKCSHQLVCFESCSYLVWQKHQGLTRSGVIFLSVFLFLGYQESVEHQEKLLPCLKQEQGLPAQIAPIIYSGLQIPRVISQKMYFKMFGSKMTR